MVTKTSLSALRALQYLASVSEAEPRTFTSVREIATRVSESPTYIAKISRELVKAGILRAERGVHGGVSLNRAVDQITLLDVVRACQGEIVENYCQTRCSPKLTCSYHHAAVELHAAIVGVLERWTLARLMVRPFALSPSGPQLCVMADRGAAATLPAKGGTR